MTRKLDAIDRTLLRLLQHDAETPMAQLAEAASLSPTPCWRRIQRLKADGLIARQVALLDARRLNVGVTVFVSVRAGAHSPAWLERFSAATRAIDEIVGVWRMSGEVDYLLRVVVPDIAAYDAVYQRLIRAVELLDVRSSFAMEEIKSSTALPLHYAV